MAHVTQQLDIRQQQKLVMTTHLQEAIRLLQLPHLDLRQYVEAHIQQNPLLETDEYAQLPSTAQERAGESETGIKEADQDYFEKMVYSDERGPKNSSHTQPEGRPFYENTLTTPKSLREHLYEQWHIDGLPHHQALAHYLIDTLDPSGYFLQTKDSIAEQLGCPVHDIETVLERLKTFDPVGVFAESLKECLTLQLGAHDLLDTSMGLLLDNLDLIGRHEWEKLLKKTHLTPEALQEKLHQIRAMNPKPGTGFLHENPGHITPDLYAHPTEGTYVIEVNTQNLPKVLLNQTYFQHLLRHTKAKEERAFIQSCYQEGNWLLKALDQRARTMLNVASEIMAHQKDFLTHGLAHMRPLKMQEVAEALGIHESTVSRIVNQKYIMTPRGLFELKYFFSTSIPQSPHDIEGISSSAIQAALTAMIEIEPKNTPHSDDKLCQLLHAQGIQVARRTVAKYRDILHIQTAAKRKRLYKFQGA